MGNLQLWRLLLLQRGMCACLYLCVCACVCLLSLCACLRMCVGMGGHDTPGGNFRGPVNDSGHRWHPMGALLVSSEFPLPPVPLHLHRATDYLSTPEQGVGHSMRKLSPKRS